MEFFTKLNDRAAEQISGGQTEPPELPISRNFGEQVTFVLRQNKDKGRKPRQAPPGVDVKNFGQAVKTINPAAKRKAGA